MPIKKEIIYPVFLECCHYADYTFWENIFEEFSEYLSFKNFMSNCYEGILETMEFLFQEFFNGVKFLDLFGIKSPYILNIILDPIKRNNLEQ